MLWWLRGGGARRPLLPACCTSNEISGNQCMLFSVGLWRPSTRQLHKGGVLCINVDWPLIYLEQPFCGLKPIICALRGQSLLVPRFQHFQCCPFCCQMCRIHLAGLGLMLGSLPAQFLYQDPAGHACRNCGDPHTLLGIVDRGRTSLGIVDRVNPDSTSHLPS